MSAVRYDTVVVPVDFSEASFAAVDAALDLVTDAAHLRVINVQPVLEPAEPGVIWNTIDNESRSRHAEQALRERLADAKYTGIHVDVAFGGAGHEIAEFAEKVGADLIVVPSHGRTGLSRMLIGSVAEMVVRLAHCPVLVIKPPKK